MTDILHRIVIETSPIRLYAALTDTTQLSQWWSRSTSTDETVSFFFGPDSDREVKMQILEQHEGERVRWQCIEGPWVDMGPFEFNIAPDERGSVLLFRHRDWPEMGDFYGHCNAKWGFFLGVSLKSFLETGTGVPHPNEPSI